MAGTPIAAADAVKLFAKSNIKVSEARAVKVRDKDNPKKERDAFETSAVALAERHVLAARDYGERVVITTIDGAKHEARK